MAIEKSIYSAPMGIDELTEGEPELEIEVIELDDVDDETLAEGLAVMESLMEREEGFSDNLAEYLDDDVLNYISDEVIEGYDKDLESRADWEKTYIEGLDLLGLTIEERTEPWEGASAVTHPILAEAVVKFQSETMVETFPAKGPVKTKIIGRHTRDKEEAGHRVREDMNILLTEKMTDYRPEHERLLWHLPLAGSAFKKVFYSAEDEIPVAQFVPAEDFVVNYGATNLKNTPRYTHRMRRTGNDLRRMQLSGFYRDVELGEPNAESDEIQDKKDDIFGYDSSHDDRYRILEVHCELDIPGYEDEDENGEYTGLELPYVVTVEKTTGIVLSIYRNWKEDDPHKRKLIHFSEYTYIPGFGFYGFGLIHLIGGFTKGATSILRQLIDAGTLSNLQGGFKTRGMRIPGGDIPISPGEYRDVDVPTGTLRDNIMTLPYKEPSVVLAGLLDKVVDEARRFASVADLNVADMQPNAPVGSTLAILERQLKTMTAVQARVHAGMKQEFKLIKEIVKKTTPDDYEYDAVGADTHNAKSSDYDMVEVIPVSDPNASSMSQRIAQYQAAMQMAQQSPELYDRKQLHRNMLDALGFENADKLVPTEDDLKPTDPVSENMKLLTGEPVKAFAYQDHQAHIQSHMAFGQDPKMQQMLQMQGEAGAAKIAAGMAHINEHLAFAYRRQIEEQLGVALPETTGDESQPLPEDVELQLSRLVAQASEKVLGINRTEVQAKQAEQAQQDPVNQQQQHEREMDKAELERKREDDKRDYEINMINALIELHKVEASQKTAGAKIGVGLAESILNVLAKKDSDATSAEIDLQKFGVQEGLKLAQSQQAAAQPTNIGEVE